MSMERRKRTWVLALTSIASLMVALDTLVVSTALTTIREDLAASVEELEWTVNSYNLSLAVLLLPAAALGDRFGRRRLFAGGLALFSAASAACALSPDVGWLIAARAVQGVGAAFVLSLSLALVSAAYPPERRGSAIGILEGFTGLAVLGGPTLGGAVAQGLSWEWVFWLNVPIGLVAICLALARIEESTAARRAPLDLPGLALVALGALGLVWGLVRGNAAGWGSAEVAGALALGLGLIVAFVAWERRTAEPMLPMRFFRLRGFAAGNAAVFCLFASLFAGVFFFAQFMQVGLGYEPLSAGLHLLPWTASLFFVAPLAGMMADRVGDRPLLAGGLALQAVGLDVDRADRRARHGLRRAGGAAGRGRARRLGRHPAGRERGGPCRARGLGGDRSRRQQHASRAGRRFRHRGRGGGVRRRGRLRVRGRVHRRPRPRDGRGRRAGAGGCGRGAGFARTPDGHRGLRTRRGHR